MNKSPFPGMDPWLERHWGDVHHRFVNYACDQIEEFLPAGLFARMEERVYVELENDVLQSRIPDVLIVERGYHGSGPRISGTSAAAVAEPLRVRVRAEPVTEGFIEIRDSASGGRVLTVIEVLSPGNKRLGQGQRMSR